MIIKKQLVTRRDENAKSETAVMYFDGQFATCPSSAEYNDFANERMFCDFIIGDQGTMMAPDWWRFRCEEPYAEWKVWPCRVGIDIDRQIVDVNYDYEQPPLKVIEPLLEEGEDIEMLWNW